MRLDVVFTPSEVEPGSLSGRAAVVVDVIRATSTIVEALANGATAIYPSASTEEALKLATSLGRDDTLLCGERKGLKIEGYDLGNSPLEYTRERVEGRALVMNTTNGTRAFLAAEEAAWVVAGAFTNLESVAAGLRDVDSAAIVCAGREGAFSLEDAVCAGRIARIAAEDREVDLNDAARAAMSLADRFSVDRDFLASTEAGRVLGGIGLGGDLERCAQVSLHAVIPTMQERVIRSA